ncbi:ATP-binding protein [Aliikangiella coralliicola]|uniref:histidine kinase n=1 Tax=Aliikangiella coralliicola TaxID=2592383 RepID=A0A545UJ76_9GAMM|nr:ATP-binding protein [Aliikangiella coralliicola]TQV89517.1 response regulator [Aliikangiella coralliicola]
MRLTSFLCALLFCFVSYSAHSEVSATNATTKINNGLFSPILYRANTNSDRTFSPDAAIAQDDKGFIWYGSGGGLFRYDGYEYKKTKLKLPTGEVEGLHVLALLPDKEHLWIGTLSEGLFHYNMRTGEATQYNKEKGDSSSLADTHVMGLAFDHSSQLWVTTSKGLSRFDATTKTFQNFVSSEQPKNPYANYIFDLAFDSDNRLWLATANGIAHFDHESQAFHRVYTDSVSSDEYKKELKDIVVSRILIASDERIWLTTFSAGVFVIDHKKREFFALPMEEEGKGKTHAGITQAGDQIWVSGTEGVQVRNAVTGALEHVIKADLPHKHGLSNNQVFELMTSRSGLVWLSTLKGLQFYNPFNKAFQMISASKEDSKQLFESGILNVYLLGDENLLVVARDKVVTFNLTNGNISTFLENFDKDVGGIHSVIRESETVFWFGSANGKILRFDAESKESLMIKAPTPEVTKANHIKVLIVQNEKYLWFSSSAGNHRLNIKTLEFEPVVNSAGDMIRATQRKAIETCDGQLLLLASGGIGLVTKGKTELRAFTKSSGLETVKGSDLRNFEKDNQCNIYVSHNNGIDKLIEIDEDELIFEPFAAEVVKKTERVKTLLQLKNGNFWYGTEYYIDSNGRELSHFLSADGNIDDTERPDLLNMRDGRIISVSTQQMLLVNPDEFKAWQYQPPLVITEAKVEGEEVVVNSAEQGLSLKPGQTNFSVRFSSLDYTEPKSNLYRYKMLGSDDKWQEVSSELRFINYQSLTPGHYQLLIQGSNRHGEWSENSILLNIEASPFFYQTLWFKWLVGLVIVVSLFWLMQWRIRKVSAQQKVLAEIKMKAERTELVQELLEKKNNLLANISHEFKTPLTLILGPLKSLINHSENKQQSDDLQLVKRNAQRLQRMVEQILELARLDYYQEEQNGVINMSDLTRHICQSLESLFVSHQVTFTMDIEGELFVALTSDSAEKILVNLLTNAVKYNRDNGSVNLELKSVDGKIILSVSDTGIGIDVNELEMLFQRFVRLNQRHNKNIQGSGLGLALVKELVEQVDGEIRVASQTGEGTTFTISLPQAEVPALQQEVELDEEYIQQEMDILDSWENANNKLNADDSIDNQDLDSYNGKPRLLIVEDSIDMQQFIGQCLAPHFQCRFADDGQQGIAIALEMVPDIIVTDLMMPNKSGYELAQTLRADERTSHIPIIMLTAKGDNQSRIDAWKSDIDAYLAKPFDSEELVIRAKNILNIRQMLGRRLGHLIHSPNQDAKSKQEKKSDLAELSPKDQQFLNRLEVFVGEAYQQPDLDLKTTAKVIAMSERQLQRKLKALLDQTLRDYLRLYRLQRAAELLAKGHQITQVSLDVGFTTANYFSQCFKAHYGMSPSDYQSENSL